MTITLTSYYWGHIICRAGDEARNINTDSKKISVTLQKEYMLRFSGFHSGCSSNNGCFGGFLYCKVQVSFGISEERMTPIFKMDIAVSWGERGVSTTQLRSELCHIRTGEQGREGHMDTISRSCCRNLIGNILNAHPIQATQDQTYKMLTKHPMWFVKHKPTLLIGNRYCQMLSSGSTQKITCRLAHWVSHNYISKQSLSSLPSAQFEFRPAGLKKI